MSAGSTSAKIGASLAGRSLTEDYGQAPAGLSWCWELDLAQLLAALDGRGPVSPREPGTQAVRVQADLDPAKPDQAQPDQAQPETGAGSPGEGEDQDTVLDQILARDGRVLSDAEVTGRVAEFLPTGPGLAGWLATTPATALDDRALAGVASSWRRLASWAQAGELAAVSQIAARAAARDKDIGLEPDGRPARIGADATAEVCLALAMSQYGASWWTDLAVTLAWRLARTGDALGDGAIDLSRARLIAEATSVLNEAAARSVEEAILPQAGHQTLGQLRAALRRAVIIADPDGAERRREEAERRARVCLYPDEEGTATLAGQSLPGIHAAAAMARITALARAVKASGAGGGIDLLRAQVFVGLLLGTLPYIAPAPDSPPDESPDSPPDGPADSPSDESPDSPPDGPPDSPSDGPPDGTADKPPGEPSDDDTGNHSGDAGQPSGRPGAAGGCPDSSPPRRNRPGPSGPGHPAAESADPGVDPADQGAGPGAPGPGPPLGDRPADDPDSAPGGPPSQADLRPGAFRRQRGRDHQPVHRGDLAAHSGPGPDPPVTGLISGPELNPDDGGPWSGLPDPSDGDAPDDDDSPHLISRGTDSAFGWTFIGRDDGYHDNDDYGRGSNGPPIVPWPAIPAALPSWPSRFAGSQPAGLDGSEQFTDRDPQAGSAPGMLDLTISFTALAGLSAEPGRLSRLGPITAPQAGNLAALAALDPAVSWRIILISGDGLALAVARIPRARAGGRADPGGGRADRAAQPANHGLVGRVTLTVPADLLGHIDVGHTDVGHRDGLGLNAEPAGNEPAGSASGGTLALIIEAALRVAKNAAARVAQSKAADTEAGGCAHQQASSGYRPSPGLREYVAARDQTCRFSTCRQPAARGDLDHTIPWRKGGPTCACNIGGICRFHHRLKQRPGWNLVQPVPGVFVWATPAGRTYATCPDPHH